MGAVAALSFAAYLIGDLVVRESARILQVRGQPPVEASTSSSRQLLRKVFSATHGQEMDDLDSLRRELAEWITTEQGRSLKGFNVLHPDNNSTAVELSLDEQVRVEAKSGRIDERILAKNPELYSELSRLRGEAEFRAGLLPALALLYLAVAFHVPWAWWVLALIAVGVAVFEYLTLMEVFQLRSRARGIALRAVLDGLVSTPTLEAIERESEALRRGARGPVT